jgi:hypothetical protein
MARKTADPRLIALNDDLLKAQREYQRWYSRLKRAFARLEKARRKVARLHRRIEKHTANPTPKEVTTP